MELMPNDTASLVKSAREGNLYSFEKLVILYQDKVFSLAKKLTGTAHDAEDLAQEAFVKAYKHLASFRGDSDFGTWLHRIVINTYLNSKRKFRPNNVVYLDEPGTAEEGSIKKEIPDHRAGPEEVLLDKVFGEKLQKALDSLPKDQKAVIMLREVEERTYEEIAIFMSCSIGTVRSRLSRARETLRLKLEQDGLKRYLKHDTDDERRAAGATQKDKQNEIGLEGQSVAPECGNEITSTS